MKRSTVSLLLGSLLISGCSTQANSDISFQFRETPLRQLRGVELGMPARQLKRSRPAAKYSPYLGLHENIPGYGVDYQFPSANSDAASDVDAADRLAGVIMVRQFASEEEAVKAWGEHVVQVGSRRRAPEDCLRFESGGREARWYSGKMTLSIGAFPKIENTTNVGPRLIFALSPIAMMKRPDDGAPIACPTS